VAAGAYGNAATHHMCSEKDRPDAAEDSPDALEGLPECGAERTDAILHHATREGEGASLVQLKLRPRTRSLSLPVSSSLRLNEVQLVKDHNSYEFCDTPSDIVSRIAKSHVIELDCWAAGSGDWAISHSIPDLVNGQKLSQYFSAIKSWHDDNPAHDLLIVNTDFKTDWLAGSGRGEYDAIIHTYFDDAILFRPKDLKGSDADCRTGAKNGNWPKWEDLKGKLMFVMTGGPWPRHNQHMSAYVKQRIIEGDYEAKAFVAPDIDDPDDIWESASGDLDGINNEKEHVVCFNAKWDNRNKFDSQSIVQQNLLLLFWDVPSDRTNFGAAVQHYSGSIIGSTKKPEDIELDPRIGARGRDVGVYIVTFYEDDNGWEGHGDVMTLGLGKYDNKGHYDGHYDDGWNDEVRAVDVPNHVTVYMTDKDSFQTGGKGTVTIVGPNIVNIKDVASNSGLAGKVSSIEVRLT